MQIREAALNARHRLLAAARAVEWLPPLLVRLCLAAVFIPSGWGKLHDLGKVTEFFTELRIPWPHLNAVVVAFSELVCGALLLVGLMSRLAALPLIVSMTIAILTAKRADIGSPIDLFAVDELIYVVLAVLILVRGAGAISADGLLARRFLPRRLHDNQPQHQAGDRS
jgi:putative oxidoreductase